MVKYPMQLETYLKPVLSKHRGVALGVWGEAGIGKSYKVRELLKNLPCQSLSVHATSSLMMLSKALPQTKKSASWSSNILGRVAKGETLETSTIQEALGTYLAGLAPFTLHLEDVHEADLDRQEFIAALAKQVKRLKGVMLLVTSRQHLAEPFNTYRLEPLSLQETEALLEREINASLPKETCDWIYSKAAGNPLYTLEYLRFLTRQGNLWNDGKTWHWRKPESIQLPATVEALIELSLGKATQDSTHETVLQAKALLGLESSDDLLAKVSEVSQDQLASIKQHLSSQDILIGNDFAHPLYREVTLAKLPKVKRQYLARRSLEFLDHDPIEATGFLEDAALENPQALAVLEHAIRHATTTNQALQLGNLLTKKLDYVPAHQKAEIALKAAQQLHHIDVGSATRLAELASQSSEAGSTVMLEATFLQAELLAIQGHLVRAETILQRLEPFEPREVWLAQLVQLRGAAHHYSGVVEIFQAQPELFSKPDAKTAHCLARSLAQLGQRKLAEKIINTAKKQPLSKQSEILLLKASSDLAYTQADMAGMERLESQIYKFAKELGDLRIMDQALFNRALALEGLGRYQERKTCIEEAMRVCQELGDVTAYMIAQRAYGSMLHEFGNYERAEELLQGARDYLAGIDFFTYLFDAETCLSQLYRDSGRAYGSTLSLKHARAALACAERIGDPRIVADGYAVLAQAHLDNQQTGNKHILEAEQCLAKAGECLQGLDLPQAQSSLDITLAHVHKAKGHLADARTLFYKAMREAQERGAQLEQQRLGLELDHLNNDAASAQQRMQWFEQHGLLNSVNIVKGYFPELAETPKEAVGTETLPVIEALGPMQIQMQGKTEKLRGSKRQEFVALLLETRLEGHSEISKLELFDKLYPADDELKAINNLKGLVYNLRETLGANCITTTATGYALGSIETDTEQFLKTGNTQLWRGVYLQDITIESQESVSNSLHLALFEKAQILLESDPKESARVGKILLTAEPYNQDYLRLCLRAHRNSNNHKSLVRLYAEAKTRFFELGETLPETWQEFLA
jgi:tetratricopeptide (TPR) repeat protein